MEAIRNRDTEAVQRRCQPLIVGVVLIMLLAIGTALNMESTSILAPIALWVGASLAMYMLYGLCSRGNHTAAWITALFSPVVVSLFAVQVQVIVTLFSTRKVLAPPPTPEVSIVDAAVKGDI